MAILDSYPGLKVTVEIDGTTAIEYDDPDGCTSGLTHEDFHLADTNKPLPLVVKYIEAKPGSPFRFRVTVGKRLKHVDDGVFFEADVDGNEGNAIVTYSDNKHQRPWSDIIEYLKSRADGITQKHFFKFSTLEIEESNTLGKKGMEEQAEKAAKLGVLNIKCFHSVKPYTAKASDYGTAPSDPGVVSEKALKGKSVDSLTQFDTKSFPTNPTTRLYDFLDQKRRPFAIFEFRYRSMKGLIEEGIVPRPPTPTLDQTVRDMSEDEVRRLARQFLEAEREKAKNPVLKEENKRGIKREIDLTTIADFDAKYKTRRTDDGHVEIDLTDD